MYEPGLDRHEFENAWQTLDGDLRTDPAQALPELDRLVVRMLEESGYELTDPIAGDESEVVASAVNGFRSVVDTQVTTNATADAAEVEEA